MDRILLVLLRTLTVILLILTLQLRLAHAHEGTPRLELGAERIAAGVALEVRGINIAPELPISVALVGTGSEFTLGSVAGDEHGDFVQAFVIPREAIAGAYTVRAFGANRVIVAAPLAILGVAPEEENEQRDQDEPLLAPMPQLQDTSRSQPQPAIISQQPNASVAPATAPSAIPWRGAALAALGVVAVLALLLRRRAAGAGQITQ